MIPVRITIKGINSYQKEYTIDFQELIKGQLFGIFGAVGSGKSTLLEAMTLALYGQTERLNVKGDNRNYNLMNLKSNHLLIDFEFQVGNNTFRCTYSLKRKSKHFDKIDSPVHKAYSKEGADWNPIPVGSIPSIVGLSYDNFKRTIIIPQGQFQEFMQLAPTKRTQMMKEVFGLEKFDLTANVKQLRQQNQMELQLVLGGLQQFTNVNEDLVAQEQQQLELLHTDLKKREQEILQLSKVKHLVDQLDQLNIQSTQIQKNLVTSKERLSRIEDQCKQAEAAYTTIKQDFETKDTLKDQSKSLMKYIDSKQLDQSIISLTKNLKVHQTQLNEAMTSEEVQDLEIQKLEGELDQLKAKRPDLTYLTKVNDWFTKVTQLQEAKRQGERKLEIQIRQQEQIIKEAFDHPFWKKEHNPTFEQVLDRLTEFKQSRTTELEQHQSEKQRLDIDQHLNTWANQLEPGKPCPLCGATDHPAVFNSIDTAGKLQGAVKKIAELEQRLANIAEEEKRLLALNVKKESYAQNEQVIRTEQQALLNELEHWHTSFPKGTYTSSDREKVKTALTEVLEVDQAIKPLEVRLKNGLKEQKKLQQKLQKQRQDLQALKLKQGELVARKEEVDKQVDKRFVADFETWSISQITKEAKKLVEKSLAIEQAYKRAEDQMKKLQNERSIIVGAIEANTLQYQQFETQKAELITHINAAIEQSEGDWVTDWQTSQQAKTFILHFSQLEKTLQAIRGKHIRSKSRLEQLTQDLQKKSTLLKQQEELEHRGKNIEVLQQLFRGNGFVDYISSIYLKELCHAANKRFLPLTRQQLQLDVDAKNNFVVRDFLNQGKIRLAKTLSGGQLFQAALCLALALAENIGRQAKRPQQFFFIDEGFGTQDMNSLELILKTLKSLRQEGRYVGIISHVESLKQEIDVYLTVRNDELAGSTVKGSWEV